MGGKNSAQKYPEKQEAEFSLKQIVQIAADCVKHYRQFISNFDENIINLKDRLESILISIEKNLYLKQRSEVEQNNNNELYKNIDRYGELSNQIKRVINNGIQDQNKRYFILLHYLSKKILQDLKKNKLIISKNPICKQWDESNVSLMDIMSKNRQSIFMPIKHHQQAIQQQKQNHINKIKQLNTKIQSLQQKHIKKIKQINTRIQQIQQKPKKKIKQLKQQTQKQISILKQQINNKNNKLQQYKIKQIQLLKENKKILNTIKQYQIKQKKYNQQHQLTKLQIKTLYVQLFNIQKQYRQFYSYYQILKFQIQKPKQI